MSGTYTVTVGERGRLVLPAELRARAEIAEGTPLILLDAPGGLVLMTRQQLRDRVRKELDGLDLVSELLDERRARSLREDV